MYCCVCSRWNSCFSAALIFAGPSNSHRRCCECAPEPLGIISRLFIFVSMITRRLHVRICSLGMLLCICYMMCLFFRRAVSYMAILLSLQQSHTNGFSPHVCAQGCYQKRYYSIWYINKLERTSNDFLLFVLMGFQCLFSGVGHC